jgi:hypothetical protein
VQVKFLSPWCKGEALSPLVRLTLKLVKREWKAVTRSLTGNPAEHSRAWIGTRTHVRIVVTTASLRRLSAWPKTGMVKPAGQPARLDSGNMIQIAPQSNPANSEVLNSTANDAQERSKGPSALQVMEQVSTECRGAAGLSQKPKSAGKPRNMQTETRRHGR